MKYSMLLGGLAVAIASAGTANAAGLAKGTYQVDGLIASSTCGGFVPSLGVGHSTRSTLDYPGLTGTMSISTDQSTAGSAATSVCTGASGAIPGTITETCSGQPVTLVFSGKPTHAKGVYSYDITTTITGLCSFTAGSTVVLE